MAGGATALLASPSQSLTSSFFVSERAYCYNDSFQGSTSFSPRVYGQTINLSLVQASFDFSATSSSSKQPLPTNRRNSSKWQLKAAHTGSSDTVNASQEGQRDIESDGIRAEVEAVGLNSRKVSAKIRIDTPLEAVWNVLTDYPNLAEYIPSLAVNEVLERRSSGARLLQVGQQNLAFGIKFKAKAVVEVEEEPLREREGCRERAIMFNMVEGDFKRFQGTWQMHQGNFGQVGRIDPVHTILSYSVEVTPQGWLPVAVVEGIISKEICTNLFCVRKQAEYFHRCIV